MELKLNIYKGKEVEKTYTANAYDLMYGTMEDFVGIIEPDKLFSDNKMDMATAGTKLLTGSLDQLKPLFMDVFPGLTEEELRRAKVTDLIKVGKGILKYSIEEMKVASTGKNA